MLVFIYWLCLFISLILLAADWDKYSSKDLLILTMLLALIPVVNFVIAIVMIKRSWPLINKWYKEFVN